LGPKKIGEKKGGESLVAQEIFSSNGKEWGGVDGGENSEGVNFKILNGQGEDEEVKSR